MSKATGWSLNFNFGEVLNDAVDESPLKVPARSEGRPTIKLIVVALGICIVGILPATANAKPPVTCPFDECGGGAGYSGIPVTRGDHDGDGRKPPDKDWDGEDKKDKKDKKPPDPIKPSSPVPLSEPVNREDPFVKPRRNLP